jgi:hypothetical protein
MKSKPKERIIFNSEDWLSSEAEDEARKFLYLDMGQVEGWASESEVPESEVYEELRFEYETAWEEEERLLISFFNEGTFLMKGTIGRWNGNYEGGKIVSSFKEMAELWKDCDDIKLYDCNGHFYITASHHDGTNYMEVKKLTAKGERYAEAHSYMYDKELHTRLWKDSHYTILPHFAENVYGLPRKEYAS